MPSRIARYEVRGLLGRGGMGEVYLAFDPRLDRDVAIKVLPKEYASDSERLERFRREARVSSGLNHPHICTIHDIGEEHGHPYIVMEHVDGATLAATATGPLEIDGVLDVGTQVARALAAAHGAGIVHRDIKPSNIMIRSDGYVKLVDFGLARSTCSPAKGGAAGDLTETGVLVGTIRYMSPEQARGVELDGASDVFSLGVVLYELATGTHPFQADSQAELIQAVLSHTPVPADRRAPAVSAELAELIGAMLDPNLRTRPSAEDVAGALEAQRRGTGASPRRVTAGPARRTVGRQSEHAALRDAFERADAGRGHFICVTGEPGMGKTTLLGSFLKVLESESRPVHLAKGRCSERLAGSEAYLPMLEALESLIHERGGDAVARTLRAVAPSWYMQIAPLSEGDSSISDLVRETGGVSQERLKRELGALVAELSRRKPLVFVLDDIHWADASTVDLLAYLGAHCESQRVLFVLSYRPAELALAEHPFASLKLDLQARGLCREIPLEFLTRKNVTEYLDLEFPGHAFPEDLGDLIHGRTEGSPLFMADLLRYLRDRGVLVQEDGTWVVGGSLPALKRQLPESVRSMVQRKVEQLNEEDRALLLACSVQGFLFDAAIVAEALGLDAAEVEDRLHVLDRVHAFVKELEEHELPDRTLTLRYRFVHVLYQNALYASLRPARRVALSRDVAAALIRHHGENDTRISAELALLFESARDFERAAHFFLEAARHAVRIFANREAAKLAQRGLDMIRALPESEERDRAELALLVTLGPPLKDTRGWGVPEVGEVYARAIELSDRIDSSPDLFPALWGMWMTYSATADIDTLRSMGQRMLDLAEESGDRGHRLQAHHALSTTCFAAGDFVSSLNHGGDGLGLYDEKAHRDHAFLYGGHDPGSCCASFACQSLWMLGYPDQSRERGRTALQMAESRGHPVSLALTHWALGVVYQFRRELSRMREHATASRRITLDQGAPIFPSILLAWAEAKDGDTEASLAKMNAELAHPDRIPTWWRIYIHALIADVLAGAGRPEEALESICRAHDMTGGARLGTYRAELFRLEGECLGMLGPARAVDAENAMRESIAVARSQHARMLELRTLVSYSRLLQPAGRADEVRPELAELYGWFTEGFDTPDLRDARAILEPDS